MAYPGQILDNPVSGERMVFRKTAAETGGRSLTLDLYLTPDGHVPAMHVHPIVEERFRVLQGRMRFRRGLRRLVAHEGDVVTVPPGKLHRFASAGPGPAHVLVEIEPALRMEDLFETTVALAHEGRTLANGTPKPLEMALFLRAFEHELRPPFLPSWLVRLLTAPLVALAQRRGLALPTFAAEEEAA
ncbi:MAG: cupin domain-containing protein [Candidatus Dormibacteraeota bacterium]|nr:cupin domain-containing protein [Candidatus Dormibacteraeota bacterium]